MTIKFKLDTTEVKADVDHIREKYEDNPKSCQSDETCKAQQKGVEVWSSRSLTAK
jgi:hypothetical protein